MRILAFAASFRSQSYNRRLIELAARMLRDTGAEVDLADFRDFEMPLYDGDEDRAHGPPPGALELCRRLQPVQAVVIASPEYNYSIAGTLKNAVDWVSRIRPMPWKGKSVYLLSASPSAMGGIRGLWQTRIPFEGCGALVFPDMFALAHADRAFAEDGSLADRTQHERLRQEMVGFARLAEAVAPVCTPGAWPSTKQKEIAAALEEESEIQPGV